MNMDLDGIMVVAVEQAVAAPYASMRLADAGARVIKVERPEGDFARAYDTLAKGESAYFVWLNRGKESICLDLKEPQDREFLMRLVQKADVFIQNLKPGTLKKLGLPIEDMHAANPRLIACSISGFGEKGPYANLKAYDLIVQAEAGLCSITGTPESPARVGVSVCDIAAGMTAHAAILQALYAREKSNQGRHIQVSLFDALAEWMNVPYLQSLYGDFETRRTGVNHPSIAPYGAYVTGDGKQLIFSVQNAREWRGFCASFMQDAALADRPGFATAMDRLANRAALDELIEARFASLSASEAIAALEETGIAYGRLNGISDLSEHPHLRTLSVETEGGELHIICPGAQVAGTTQIKRAVPALGAHSKTIRQEFAG
jgi:crotonobetainyl-CoA:carnitine CoA-transferase CaiB-like acyl-CoA transferase